MKKKENKVDGILVLNEDGSTKASYKNADEMFDAFKNEFKRDHPFSYWFDGQFDRMGFFGYAPHVIFSEPLKVIVAGWQRIVWAYQRVVRGYDDRATWGISYWMNDLIPKILKQMKGSSYGVPITFFQGECDKNGNYPEGEEERAAKLYDKVLSDLIGAFDELKKLEEFQFDYENKTIKQNLAEYNKRMKEAKKKLGLLIEYYYEIGD